MINNDKNSHNNLNDANVPESLNNSDTFKSKQPQILAKQNVNIEPDVGHNLHRHKAVRWLFLLLGFVFIGIGLLGMVLPGLPTTVFMILAAACWAKGSERFYNWIMNHKLFGKMVKDWQDKRAMPRRAKYLAWSMMTISCVFMFYRMPAHLTWVAVLTTIFCASTAIWMARLPDA